MWVKITHSNRVQLIANNGRILQTSETYYSFWGAKRAARKMYPNLSHYDARDSSKPASIVYEPLHVVVNDYDVDKEIP